MGAVTRMAAIALTGALASCGDNMSPASELAIVGHHDLGARGMNSALAIAGDVAYVGSRIDIRGIAIIDISDPAQPIAVGEIPGAPTMSPRELRAVPELDLLIVLNMQCDAMLHGCTAGAGQPEALELYDITDRRAPVHTASYPIRGRGFIPRGPHEFYLHRAVDRVLVFVAAPPAEPSLEVVDVTDKRAPTMVVAWSPTAAGLHPDGADDILHSVSLSRDGRRAYLSHQLSGLLVADVSALPAITLITPATAALDFAPPSTIGPHSAVEVPGRNLLVVTEEVYPAPYGTGCPWGKLRMVDVADPVAPQVIGEFALPENDPAGCAQPHDRMTFTAHNATATEHLAFVTWYAGGLQILDTTDPTAPRQLIDFRPAPLAAVAAEDPALGGVAVEMWSYPIIKDGLIYVVDVRNGLYVLRYTGVYQHEVFGAPFLEGNSNL